MAQQRMRPVLVIFVKEPRPGRVKTRLARDVGHVAAARWYRTQTARLLRRVGRDPRWHTVLAVSPDADGMASRVWPPGIARWPQGRGGLGARMARALRAHGPGPVAIIGSDVPGIDAAALTRAFQALAGADAAIGPSPDGGYWLVGLRHGGRVPAGLFDAVRWSTEHARADTLASFGDRRVALTDMLADVDNAADLASLGLPRP